VNGTTLSRATIEALVRGGFLVDTPYGWQATREAFCCFRVSHEFASRTRFAFGLDDEGDDRVEDAL
jgi:hypothetical protein